MNPAKVAAHYGIPEDWVRFCRDEEIKHRRTK